MLQHENIIRHHEGLDDRTRQIRQHKLAAHRNFLDNEKRTLSLELNKMAPSIQVHYLKEMYELSRQIKESKKKNPILRGQWGQYD